MTIEDWLADACADAERRGLSELKPLLASVADATRDLRAVQWEPAPYPGRRASNEDLAAAARPQPTGEGGSAIPRGEGPDR